METQNQLKTAIWMDKSKATIIGYYPGRPFGIEHFESPIDNHLRIEGEDPDKTVFTPFKGGKSNNEARRNHTYEAQLKKYFLELDKKLLGTEQLILLGPGILKNQYLNHLKEIKNFSELTITVLDVDKLTHKQLLALIKDQFED